MEFSTSNILLPNIVIDSEKTSPLVTEKIKFPIIDEDQLNLAEELKDNIHFLNINSLSPKRRLIGTKSTISLLQQPILRRFSNQVKLLKYI